MSLKIDTLLAVRIRSIIQKYNVSEATYLLNKTSKDNYKRTLLHIAAFHGLMESLRELLAFKKIDLNIQDYQAATPLDLACYMNRADVIKALIVRGAVVSKHNKPVVDKVLADVNDQSLFIFNEILNRNLEGWKDSNERKRLYQRYLECKNEYHKISKASYSDEDSLSTAYFSLKRIPIGTQKLTCSPDKIDEKIVDFLEV